MAGEQVKMSRSEWRNLSQIAAAIDWATYGADRGLGSKFDERTANALQLLLRPLAA